MSDPESGPADPSGAMFAKTPAILHICPTHSPTYAAAHFLIRPGMAAFSTFQPEGGPGY